MNWNQRQDPRQQNWSNQQQQSSNYGRQGSQSSTNYQQNSYGQGQSNQSYNQPYVPTVQTQTPSYGYNDNQNQGQYYPSAQTSNQSQPQSSYYSQQSSRGPSQSAQPQQQRYNPTSSSQYTPSGSSQQYNPSSSASQQYNPSSSASQQYNPSSSASQQYNPSSSASQQYNPRTSQSSATPSLGQYGGVTSSMSSGAQSGQPGASNLNNLSQILSSLTNLSGLVNIPGGSTQQSMPQSQSSNMSSGLNMGSNAAGLNSLLRGVQQQQQQPQQQVQLPGNLSQLLQQSTGAQPSPQQNQALQLLTAQLLQQQQQQQQQNTGGYKPATQSHMSMPSRPMGMGAPVSNQSRFSSGPPQRNPAPSLRGRSNAPAPRADFGGRGGHRGGGGRDFDRDRSDRDRNDRGRSDDRKRFDRDVRPDRDRNDRDRPVRTDRDRNDRDRPYRRSKSPEHKRDKSPPPKPREKTPPKTVEPSKDKETSHTEVPKKELTEKDKEREREKRKYECKISAHEITSFERDYASTRRRYENLYITPDFAKSLSSWQHSVPLEEPLPLDHHVPFTCDNEFREVVDPVNNETPALQADHTRWFAKVVLLTGYSADDYDEIMDSDKQKDVTQKLKFIVQRQDRSQLMLLGGEWEPTIDGDGDPAQDNTLIPSAIRHVREQIQLDLSPCTRWYRFLEIHYHRVVPNTVPAMVARDITVIYVPAVWDLIPSMDDFMATWEQREYTKLKRQKDKEERARLEREKIEKERLEKQEKERAEKEKAEKERLEKQKQEAAPESENTDQPINLNQSAGDQPTDQPAETAPVTETTETAAPEQPAQPAAETMPESEPTSKSESEIVVDKSKAPKDITIYLNTKREKFLNRKTAQLSLDGLLDYDYEGDRWEPTFEVSLFAENFHEMLQRDFGHIVLQAIMNASPEKPSQDKKRRREDVSEEERSAKKQKTEETKPVVETTQETPAQADPTAKPETAAEQSSETTSAPETTTVAPETKSEQVKAEEHHEPERKINYSLKFAFEFFDRNRTGYLKSEDVETMFHALGFHVSKNQMHAILAHQLDTKHRLFYKNLLYTEENEAEHTDGHNDAASAPEEPMDLNA